MPGENSSEQGEKQQQVQPTSTERIRNRPRTLVGGTCSHQYAFPAVLQRSLFGTVISFSERFCVIRVTKF